MAMVILLPAEVTDKLSAPLVIISILILLESAPADASRIVKVPPVPASSSAAAVRPVLSAVVILITAPSTTAVPARPDTLAPLIAVAPASTVALLLKTCCAVSLTVIFMPRFHNRSIPYCLPAPFIRLLGVLVPRKRNDHRELY